MQRSASGNFPAVKRSQEPEEHKNPESTLNYDFPSIEEIKPIVTFNLEPKLSLSKSARTSFYSFVHWYLHLDGGIFSLDYIENEFSIFDETRPGEYHGRVREWKDLRPEQKSALVKAGKVDVVNGKGKILD